MEIAEGFEFNRFEEARPAAGDEYELETFKYATSQAILRIISAYRPATTPRISLATRLARFGERHLQDAVDTWARTIKKAYRYTGITRLTADDFRLDKDGRLYLKDGNVELTHGVGGRYKPISELKPSSGTGFPYNRIKEIFPDFEAQGRPLGRAELKILRKAVEDAPGESTEEAATAIQKSINSLPQHGRCSQGQIPEFFAPTTVVRNRLGALRGSASRPPLAGRRTGTRYQNFEALV